MEIKNEYQQDEPSGNQPGTLVISLDFELLWGVREAPWRAAYTDNLLGARKAIPKLLDVFEEYGIHSTWATVGFLCFDKREDLIKGFPAVFPVYADKRLDPYLELESIGPDEQNSPLYFAKSLVRLIQQYEHQELASHTFSHFYCLEKFVDESCAREAFAADLRAAAAAIEQLGGSMRSLVFPKNQVNGSFLDLVKKQGIRAFRGPQPHWLHRPTADENASQWLRALRLMDAYLKITPAQTYSRSKMFDNGLVNVAGSRFLRPYSRRLKHLEGLKIRRLKSELDGAARRGHVYHLWWHPHNFGVNLPENLTNLRRLLDHFKTLEQRYGMQSMNMSEISSAVLQ